ncbi:MAG: hydroxymethylbilane synthase [Actinomycetota bacterium]
MRIATRGSALARWQADHVADLLRERGVEGIDIVVVETSGDRDTTSPLHSIGGKGVFCKEIQAAVLDGRADIAVHSAKDLPAITPPGLTLAAVPARGDVRDCLVGSTLNALPEGASVATGSVRRRAQLARHRPDLVFHELRGNIATRLSKLAGFDAIVMAVAALDRLGHDVVGGAKVDPMPIETMVPQVGQGALAIECRFDDDDVVAALGSISDPLAVRLVSAERAFLRELGGDCSLPAAAHAIGGLDGELDLVGFLAASDLSTSHQLRLRGEDGEALGVELAQTLRSVLGRR